MPELEPIDHPAIDLSLYDSRYYTMYLPRGQVDRVPLVTDHDFDLFDTYYGTQYGSGRQSAPIHAWNRIKDYMMWLPHPAGLENMVLYEPDAYLDDRRHFAGIRVKHFVSFARAIDVEDVRGYGGKSKELVRKLASYMLDYQTAERR